MSVFEHKNPIACCTTATAVEIKKKTWMNERKKNDDTNVILLFKNMCLCEYRCMCVCVDNDFPMNISIL